MRKRVTDSAEPVSHQSSGADGVSGVSHCSSVASVSARTRIQTAGRQTMVAPDGGRLDDDVPDPRRRLRLRWYSAPRAPGRRRSTSPRKAAQRERPILAKLGLIGAFGGVVVADRPHRRIERPHVELAGAERGPVRRHDAPLDERLLARLEDDAPRPGSHDRCGGAGPGTTHRCGRLQRGRLGARLLDARRRGSKGAVRGADGGAVPACPPTSAAGSTPAGSHGRRRAPRRRSAPPVRQRQSPRQTQIAVGPQACDQRAGEPRSPRIERSFPTRWRRAPGRISGTAHCPGCVPRPRPLPFRRGHGDPGSVVVDARGDLDGHEHASVLELEVDRLDPAVRRRSTDRNTVRMRSLESGRPDVERAAFVRGHGLARGDPGRGESHAVSVGLEREHDRGVRRGRRSVGLCADDAALNPRRGGRLRGCLDRFRHAALPAGEARASSLGGSRSCVLGGPSGPERAPFPSERVGEDGNQDEHGEGQAHRCARRLGSRPTHGGVTASHLPGPAAHRPSRAVAAGSPPLRAGSVLDGDERVPVLPRHRRDREPELAGRDAGGRSRVGPGPHGGSLQVRAQTLPEAASSKGGWRPGRMAR